MKDRLKTVKEEIEAMFHNGSSTQQLWDYCKTELDDSIDKNIPQKMANTKDGNPWITRDIKRLIRKRDRLYKKQKKNKNQEMQVIERNIRN